MEKVNNVSDPQGGARDKERRNPQVFLKEVETFHCAPDDTEYKGERIATYFEEVVDILYYNDKAKEAFLSIEYKTLCFEDATGEFFRTNDRVGYLKAHGALIAFSMETRTEFDFIDVTMVCTITPELLLQLQRNEAVLKKD